MQWTVSEERNSFTSDQPELMKEVL